MTDTYRSTRTYHEEEADNGLRSTTVTRYKIGSSRSGDRIEVEDDTRSRFSSNGCRVSNDLLERERSRKVVETRDMDREWDRRTRPDDVRVERVERRVEESFEDSRGPGLERYRKETEYYSPAEPNPPPVILRQQAPEPQKIIFQEAPPAQPVFYSRDYYESGPVVLREHDVDRQLVRRDGHEDDYYYRHEHRDVAPVGPYRGDSYYHRDSYARDRDWAMARHDGRRREEYYSEDEDYYVSTHRRRPTRSRHRRYKSRSRSRSRDDHRLHLAEGALAGAGVTALIQGNRDRYGDLPENRGRKVIAGAALGALGTELLTRAHSAYGERWRDLRESPGRHSRLKTGFGVAAVALAAAGAAKYFQTNKIEKEEAHRGRSRNRGYVSDDYYESESRSRSVRGHGRRRSISTAAKAALGTVATAGVLRHLHNRSRSRARSKPRSHSRSKSRLRTGAKIAGAAAAAGVAGKLFKNHQQRKERSRSRALSDTDDDHYHRHRDTSRSPSRSMARSLYSDAGADRELGLVEYGQGAVPPERRAYESDNDPSSRRSTRRRERSPSSSASDDERKRSTSRMRDMAAAGAAALGIKEYNDKKDGEKRERRSRERSRGDDDYNDGYGRGGPHNDRYSSPPHASGGAYLPPYPTTPGLSGDYNSFGNPGAAQSHEYPPYVPQDYMGYIPAPPPGPPPAPAPGPMTGFPPGSTGLSGPLPSPDPQQSGLQPGPSTGPGGPSKHVSNFSQPSSKPVRSKRGATVNEWPRDWGPLKTPPAPAKSVSFIPLSLKSTWTMAMHRRQQEEAAHGGGGGGSPMQGRDGGEDDFGDVGRLARRRRSSDTTHNRPRGQQSLCDADDSVSEPDIEELSDRFDEQGKRLDRRSYSLDMGGGGGWNSRSGSFQRQPRRFGDWHASGAWHVGDTDKETVERLARNVSNAIDGRGSWLHVLGDVLRCGGEPLGGGEEG